MSSRQASRVAEMVAQLGGVRDEYVLQALILVAQELKLLDTAYSFDFRRNVPFSSELSRDIYMLVVEEHIRDTKGLSSLVSNSGPKKEAPHSLGCLRELEPGVLLALSRLLMAVKKGKDLETTATELLTRERVSPDCLNKALAFRRQFVA